MLGDSLSDYADPTGVGARDQFVPVEQQRATRVDRKRGGPGFRHYIDRLRSYNRNVEQQVLAAPRSFDQPQ
jgi:hypothetical protein